MANPSHRFGTCYGLWLALCIEGETFLQLDGCSNCISFDRRLHEYPGESFSPSRSLVGFANTAKA